MEKKMIFVAASITGGREALPFVKFIIKHLQDRGFDVPSIHNAADNPNQAFIEKMGDHSLNNAKAFRKQNNEWIEKSKLFVSEISTPSHGVGAEFEHCLLKPRMGLKLTPMLCLYMEGKNVSPHITGVTDFEQEFIWFRSYRDENDLSSILDEFIKAMHI